MVERYGEHAAIGVADLLEREGELASPQIVAQRHARHLAELARCMKLGVAQPPREGGQRERLVVAVLDTLVDLVDDRLDLPFPLVHASNLLDKSVLLPS